MSQTAVSRSESFKVVIPSRYAATRLPGKPLIDIGGRPLIQHVWERARASRAAEIIIATDDARIATVCEGLGATVSLTARDHASGTDRIAEVSEQRGWSDDTIIVNLQGDEPCMPPALIDQVAGALLERPTLGIATLGYPIAAASDLFDPHVVKLVTDQHGNALYFSRAPIPWHRDEFRGDRGQLPGGVDFLRHIGLYGYRAGFVRRFVRWPVAPLERAEALEQLRVLWHGEPLYVGRAVAQPGPGVDTRADLARAAAWLNAA